MGEGKSSPPPQRPGVWPTIRGLQLWLIVRGSKREGFQNGSSHFCFPDLETIQGLLGTQINAAAVQHRGGINLLVKIVRRNYVPCRFCAQDAYGSRLACEINLVVSGSRGGKVIPAARN